MCYTNEKSGVCRHTTEISWDTVGGKETVLMHTPCSHLLNSTEKEIARRPP